MATPYQNVAKAALINWNGLTEEEANIKIQSESIKELEGQVYAMDSVKNAVLAIAKELELDDKETLYLLDATINGPEDAEIFKLVSEKTKGFTNTQILNVLSSIHNSWVVGNCNEKTFNKKVERQQLRQYTPLELIGWNEVKSDLLFLKPILEVLNISLNEEVLSEEYHNLVSTYLAEMEIYSQEDLSELISLGKKYYPILPNDIEEKITFLIETVSQQIIDNWNEKDIQTAEIFENRKGSK